MTEYILYVPQLLTPVEIELDTLRIIIDSVNAKRCELLTDMEDDFALRCANPVYVSSQSRPPQRNLSCSTGLPAMCWKHEGFIVR